MSRFPLQTSWKVPMSKVTAAVMLTSTMLLTVSHVSRRSFTEREGKT